jgi:hypothetical protein
MLVAVGCRKAPNKPGAVAAGGGPGGASNAQVLTDYPIDVSLDSYKANLYDPIINQECNGSCHQHDEHLQLESSHTYMVARYMNPEQDFARINFAVPAQSQAAVRIAANHNCADTEICTEDFVVEGITKWKEDIEAAGYEIPKPEYPNQTGEVAFNSGVAATVPADPADYLAQRVSEATGTNGYATPIADDPDGPIEMALGVPPGTSRQQGDAAAGVATFNMEALTAGDYFVWVRTKISEPAANAFFITVNGQTQTLLGQQTDDRWDWIQLADEDENPLTFTLPAGPVTVDVQEADGGPRFNMILLTPRDDANRELFVTNFYDVEIDVSDVAGTNAKIVATVWEKAQEEGQKKAVGVQELRVVSGTPLRVAGIKPLINGVFLETHATYLLVDTVAGGGTDRASQIIDTGGATGTTWLGDWSKDKLSFSFEVIEPAE